MTLLDVFRIGVSLGMTNNVSQVLGVVQRDLFGLRKSVDLTTGSFNTMKLAAIGAMGVVAGGAILVGLGKIVEAGAQVVHQQQLMYTAGMSNKEVALATAAAWKDTAKVMGTSITENLKSIRELRMVFGDTSDAIKYLPIVTTAQQILGSTLGKDSQDQVFALAKALEIKGVSMDPQHFASLLDGMIKAAEASGGRVNGGGFLSAFKYGRAATQGWSDQFIEQILPTLIQEMSSGSGGGGSGGPGNALMSAYAAVVGGTMTNKAAEQFLKLHLINRGGIVETKTGDIKGIRPGGVSGSSEFASDPYAWVQDYLMPAFAKAKITDPVQMREVIAHMFQNRTAQQIIDMFATQQVRFQKDAALQKQATGLGGWQNLINNDLTTNWNAFTTSIKNFVAALGVPLVPLATKFIHGLTVSITELSLWVAAHQDATRQIGIAAASIASLLVGLGAVAVLVAAGSALALAFSPAGWMVLGFTALGTVIASIPGAFQGAEQAIKAFVNAITDPASLFATPDDPGHPGYHYQKSGRNAAVLVQDTPSSAGIYTQHYGRHNPSLDGPMPVVVVNPRDIANASAAHVANQLSRPNRGASGANPRAFPPGSAALTTP